MHKQKQWRGRKKHDARSYDRAGHCAYVTASLTACRCSEGRFFSICHPNAVDIDIHLPGSTHVLFVVSLGDRSGSDASFRDDDDTVNSDFLKSVKVDFIANLFIS